MTKNFSERNANDVFDLYLFHRTLCKNNDMRRSKTQFSTLDYYSLFISFLTFFALLSEFSCLFSMAFHKYNLLK